MSKITTTGRRYLEKDRWHDANGPIPGSPADWDPPMSEDEVIEAARSDPDALPLDDNQLAGMRRISFATHVRWKLRLGQSEFASRFQIPLETVRAWERHDAEPDAAAMAYLRVIAEDPEAVTAALAKSELQGVE